MAIARYRSAPKCLTSQPVTAVASVVIAPRQSPRRRSVIERDSSSTRNRSVAVSHCATSLNTGGNQVARESALMAIDNGTRAMVRRNATSVSACSNAILRAAWASTSPDSVASTGDERRTSTRPISLSRALMRWLTADGEMPRTTAAASKLPSSKTASKVARCV